MSHADEIYFKRWQARRDADAFAELVSRHSGMMYAAAKRVLGSAADAEDVVQESFLRLARQNSTIHSIPGWLYQVTVRLSLSRLRTEKRRRQRDDRYNQERGASDSGDPQWDEILPVVDEALAELPDKVRAAIVLRFLEGRTHAAAAETLGVSRSAVQKRIEKGLNQIRISLNKRGISSSVAALGVLFATHMKADAAPPTLLAVLGKQTLASMSTTPTVSKFNPPFKGAISMVTKNPIKSLGVLAICGLTILMFLNVSFRGDAVEAPPKLATVIDETYPPSSLLSSDEVSFEATTAPAHRAPEHSVTQLAMAEEEPTSIIEPEEPKGGVIEGVALVGGQPLANLAFTIGAFAAGTPGRSSFNPVSVTTDNTGKFRIEGLEEFDGNLYPTRMRPDGGMQDALFVPVEIRNDKVTEVVIDFIEGISSIEGTVFYGNRDNPIQARFELIFTWNEAGVYNEEIIRSSTDEAGNFRIGGLPAGNAEVHTFATVDGQRVRLVSNIRLGQGEHAVENIVISAVIVKCDVTNIPENTKQMFVLAHPGEFDLQVTDISSFIQARDSMVAVSRHSGRTSGVTAFLNGLPPGRYTIGAIAWPTEYNLAEVNAYGMERFFNDMKYVRTYITIETMDEEHELHLDFATLGE